MIILRPGIHDWFCRVLMRTPSLPSATPPAPCLNFLSEREIFSILLPTQSSVTPGTASATTRAA
jgi:hypothetical protein